ncbi:MAG: hypothetical protein J5967_07760 [Oscillospiraceae bacterium]|nr:hypothetical protein [Oscillospiraceae bacterium]
MKKKRLSASFTVFFLSLWILLRLPKEELRFTLRLLRSNLGNLPRLLRFLWRAEPTRLLALGIFAVLALACLISLLTAVAGLCRALRERQSRPELAARREKAVGSRYPAGREKYLRQLDDHLRNGLIDKAEYKLLRERYLRMDIGDSAR